MMKPQKIQGNDKFSIIKSLKDFLVLEILSGTNQIWPEELKII